MTLSTEPTGFAAVPAVRPSVAAPELLIAVSATAELIPMPLVFIMLVPKTTAALVYAPIAIAAPIRVCQVLVRGALAGDVPITVIMSVMLTTMAINNNFLRPPYAF